LTSRLILNLGEKKFEGKVKVLGSEDPKVKMMALSRQQRKKKVEQLPYFLSLKLIYATQKLFRIPQKHILYALQKRNSYCV
jgi:hypothetical protein